MKKTNITSGPAQIFSSMHCVHHFRKPRLLHPLRSIHKCIWNEVDLAPLACQDVFAYAADTPLQSVHINDITKHKFILFHLFNCIGNVKILIHRKIEHYIRLSDIII